MLFIFPFIHAASCRGLDPVVMPSAAGQAVKTRLLTFVRSLSTVLAVAYILTRYLDPSCCLDPCCCLRLLALLIQLCSIFSIPYVAKLTELTANARGGYFSDMCMKKTVWYNNSNKSFSLKLVEVG
jgi:hypothetical protein